MPLLSERRKIEILIMVGCGDKIRSQMEVVFMFNDKYPETPISQSAVSKICAKFEGTGSVKNLPGKGRKGLDEESKLSVLLEIFDNPHSTCRQLAENNNTTHITVQKLLKKEIFHPYKVKLVQTLNEDDSDRRINFFEDMMEILIENPGMLGQIIFSDEATFSIDGEINWHNCRYWALESPHWLMEHKSQTPQKLNVWAGFARSHVIGPYFVEGNLNGEMYLHFLHNELIPALAVIFPNEEDPDIPNQSMWSHQLAFCQQHGGAPLLASIPVIISRQIYAFYSS